MSGIDNSNKKNIHNRFQIWCEYYNDWRLFVPVDNHSIFVTNQIEHKNLPDKIKGKLYFDNNQESSFMTLEADKTKVRILSDTD